MTKKSTPRISAPINEDTAERLKAIADHMGQGFSPANVAALAIADGLPLIENRLTGKTLPECFRLAVRTVPIDSMPASEVGAAFERSEEEIERRKAAGLIREVALKTEQLESSSLAEPIENDEDEAAQALAAGLPEVKPPPKAKAPKPKKSKKKAKPKAKKPEPKPEPITTTVGGIELTWDPSGDESMPEYFARVQSAQLRAASEPSGNGRADQGGALSRANGAAVEDDEDEESPDMVDPTRCPHGVRWDAPDPCDACDSSGF